MSLKLAPRSLASIWPHAHSLLLQVTTSAWNLIIALISPYLLSQIYSKQY